MFEIVDRSVAVRCFAGGLVALSASDLLLADRSESSGEVVLAVDAISLPLTTRGPELCSDGDADDDKFQYRISDWSHTQPITITDRICRSQLVQQQLKHCR